MGKSNVRSPDEGEEDHAAGGGDHGFTDEDWQTLCEALNSAFLPVRNVARNRDAGQALRSESVGTVEHVQAEEVDRREGPDGS